MAKAFISGADTVPIHDGGSRRGHFADFMALPWRAQLYVALVVLAVIVYTAVTMLRAALVERRRGRLIAEETLT